MPPPPPVTTAERPSSNASVTPRRSRRRRNASGLPRRCVGGFELLLDDAETTVPERRVAQVAVDDPAQLLGRARATLREQLEVGGHDRGAAFLVPAATQRRQH